MAKTKDGEPRDEVVLRVTVRVPAGTNPDRVQAYVKKLLKQADSDGSLGAVGVEVEGGKDG